MSGWIKIHRSIEKWQWFHCPKHTYVFLNILLRASYDGNKTGLLDLEKGQLVIGLKEFSLQCGVSIQNLRTILTHFKSTDEITTKTNSQGSVITVVNWNKYQLSTSELTSNQQSTNNQLTTIKKAKKEKKERTNMFDEKIIELYLKYYPRKGARGEGVKKLSKHVKNTHDLEDLTKAMINYAQCVSNRKAEHIKLFPTFASNWRDYINPEDNAVELNEMEKFDKMLKGIKYEDD